MTDRTETHRIRRPRFFSLTLRDRHVMILLAIAVPILVSSPIIWEKLTRPTYRSLYYGMTIEEVNVVMGEPKRVLQVGDWTQRSYWGDGRKTGQLVHLEFSNEELVGTFEKGGPPRR